MPSKGIALKHVLPTAGVAFVLAYGLLRWWTGQGNILPTVNWFTVAVEVLIGALVLVGGWQIRQYRRHESNRMPQPQQARRIVISAQASALVGAALGGFYAAHVLIALGNLDSDRLRAIAVAATAAVVASAAMTAVGLVVQGWCRIDPDDDNDDDRRGGASAL
ncbi:DUF3180 domain-containing protein [Calidifontibacter terrae]